VQLPGHRGRGSQPGPPGLKQFLDVEQLSPSPSCVSSQPYSPTAPPNFFAESQLRAAASDPNVVETAKAPACGAALNACRTTRRSAERCTPRAVTAPAGKPGQSPLSIARWRHAMNMNAPKALVEPVAARDSEGSLSFGSAGRIADLDDFVTLQEAALPDDLYAETLEFAARPAASA
jgi:hypothetical protein